MVVVRSPSEKSANGLQDSQVVAGDAISLPLSSTDKVHTHLKQAAADSTNPNYEMNPECKVAIDTDCGYPEQAITQRSKWTDVNRTPLPPSTFVQDHLQAIAQNQSQGQGQGQGQSQHPNQHQHQPHSTYQAHAQQLAAQGKVPQMQETDQKYSNQNAQDHIWQEMQQRDKQNQQQRKLPSHLPLMQYNPGKPRPVNSTPGKVGNGLPQIEKQFSPFNPKNSSMLSNNPNIDLQQNSMANGLLHNQQQHSHPLDNTWSGQASSPQDGNGEGAQFEIITPTAPGKPPQYIMRTATPLSEQDLQGFPPQRTPQRYYPRYQGGMQNMMRMQPPSMMQQGMLPPGMNGMMPPQMMMPPSMPQMMGHHGMTTMTQVPPTMPPAMAADITTHVTATPPTISYPYGYGNTNHAHHAYQPSYHSHHGMHQQSANTTVAQNYIP